MTGIEAVRRSITAERDPRPAVTDWRHRARGIALLAGVLALGGAVVARNPEAIGVGVLGLIVFGVLAMFVGLAWLFLTGTGGG